MRLLLLLLSGIAWGQPAPNNPNSTLRSDSAEVEKIPLPAPTSQDNSNNNSLATQFRQFQRGRTTIPGKPTFLNGVCFGDGSCLTSAGGSSSSGNSPSWTKYNLTYANFSTAGTASTIVITTAAANTVVHAVKIQATTPFTGGAISAYTISVGTAAAVGGSSAYATAFDVFQTTSNTTYQLSYDWDQPVSASTYTITATANSTGANLSVSTGGAVGIWILTSTTP